MKPAVAWAVFGLVLAFPLAAAAASNSGSGITHPPVVLQFALSPRSVSANDTCTAPIPGTGCNATYNWTFH